MSLAPAKQATVIGPPPPYDAECAEYLTELPDSPPLTFDSVIQLREALSQAPGPSDEELALGGRYVVETHRAPGPPGSPEVQVLVCRPVSCRRPVPALYFAHSGGMIGGTCRHGLMEAVQMADQVGAAVLSVEYRLAPETRHPGPVEDCYAGLLWAVENAGRLGLDTERITLLGGSAGGGLCAGLALMARDHDGPRLLGQLLMGPMLDDRNDSVSAHQMAGERMWNRADNEMGWSALLGEARGGPGVSAYAAPARAQDLSHLPATYIDVGSTDTFRDECVTFATRIWQVGGVAELHVWPGGFHGFDGLVPHAPLSRAAVSARATWLRRLLDQSGL